VGGAAVRQSEEPVRGICGEALKLSPGPFIIIGGGRLTGVIAVNTRERPRPTNVDYRGSVVAPAGAWSPRGQKKTHPTLIDPTFGERRPLEYLLGQMLPEVGTVVFAGPVVCFPVDDCPLVGRGGGAF